MRGVSKELSPFSCSEPGPSLERRTNEPCARTTNAGKQDDYVGCMRVEYANRVCVMCTYEPDRAREQSHSFAHVQRARMYSHVPLRKVTCLRYTCTCVLV